MMRYAGLLDAVTVLVLFIFLVATRTAVTADPDPGIASTAVHFFV